MIRWIRNLRVLKKNWTLNCQNITSLQTFHIVCFNAKIEKTNYGSRQWQTVGILFFLQG